MSKTITMLLVGVMLVAGAGILFTADEAQARYGYGMMYGGGYGACPGFGGGYGASYYDGEGGATFPEVTVATLEDALKIAQADINADVKSENIYPMGRWWVVQAISDEGIVTQNYIDVFTGEVVDFTDRSYTYGRGNFDGSYENGYGLMYGGGYGHMPGYGGGYSHMPGYGMGYGGMYNY